MQNFFSAKTCWKIAEIGARNETKSDDIQGEAMKFIILSNITDTCTRLEVALG